MKRPAIGFDIIIKLIRVNFMNDLDKKPKASKKSKDKKYLERRDIGEIFLDLIKILPGMVIETDLKGNIRFISKKGIEMLGYTEEELKDKTIYQLVSLPGRPNSEK